MAITRRTFLKGAAALPVLPVLGAGCGNDVTAAPIVDVAVGTDEDDAVHYGRIAVFVPQYPDLAAVGGAVTLRVAPLAPGVTAPFTVPESGVLLIHPEADTFVATAADCPHQGCPLGYNAKDEQIQCPCHSSRFRAVADPTDEARAVGSVLHLPATQDLLVYGVQVVGDMVYVNLNDTVPLAPVDTASGTITVPIAQFTELTAVGGSIIGVSKGLDDHLLIARVDTDQFVVVSAICPHQRYPLAFNPDDLAARRFHCTGHGSQFSFDGSVLKGPSTGDPVAPIKVYQPTFDGTNLVVTVG